MTASEEPRPTTTTWERKNAPSTAQEQTPSPTTMREQTSTPATQSGPSLSLPLSRHFIPASAPTAPVRHDECSPAPVGREDLGSSLRMCGHGSLFSVARQLVLDPHASRDLGEVGVHSGAPLVEERERRAEQHGAAGAGGVEGIQGMEEEVAGAVGGVVDVADGAHIEREEVMVRVHDGEQVERVEGVLPSEVEREEDVVRTQVEREAGVAGVDDGDASVQVEMEEDVVRADAAVLVGEEEGVVGGGVAHGRGEGGDHLYPIVQCFVNDEMGPALAGGLKAARPLGHVRGVAGLATATDLAALGRHRGGFVAWGWRGRVYLAGRFGSSSTRVMRDKTPHKSGAARQRPMPVAVGAALGESSGAEGLGMPRDSRCEKTVVEVTHVSARVIRVRMGAGLVTVVEDDPKTEPAREEAPHEDDEYRDNEESEEEESDSGEDGSYDDDDEPSPLPRRGSGRRFGSSRRRDDVDDPSPPGRWEARSRRRRGSSVATVPGRGSVSSTRNTGGERQRGSGKGKGGRRY
ncbi:hypothetical protein CBR_g21100 [Chara braunii]|uniref:Uncharacterized protein n=1 Tax=Chara braunii TaxID=69332 RepID=A0A388L0J9_CHABU|nr:hypothetical protein CBR_g21100 [Chara braunii]|eukprot:GBG75856.1 hypothetical protein CBR_g21100 [Chara braunii]